MRHAESKLLEMGCRVLFISPDSPEKLYPSLQEKDINYVLLSDNGIDAVEAFGVAFRLDEKTLEAYRNYGGDLEEASGRSHHMLPVPAMFLVDKDGMIQFQYANPDYEMRLHPDVLLAAARVVLEKP